ncbi:MAG: exodeoxyribonuclease VII large subunit [Bacillota bacterium]
MKVLTVGELTRYIKGIFERDHLLANLWVKGEISNYKAAGSGHVYFTLKDRAGCIRSVMFRSRAQRLGFMPEDGMAVRVRGYVSVYDRDGNYQLYVEEMEPDGIGALYVAFEQLKERLRKEGLFDPSIKKKIPFLPERIGIVTSPTGAAVRDMLEIIQRRWPGAKIVLVPVTVQGDSAPGEVSRAIKILNRKGEVDVIIVGRGGGSLEELWAFNTEEVARSIHESVIPVISAVGHETDFTIADMVADLRAPTPSAAAELVVPVKSEVAYTIDSIRERIYRAMGENAGNSRRRLENCLESRTFRNPVDGICGARAIYLDMLNRNMLHAMQKITALEKSRLAVAAGRLQSLSPLSTLARGYSVCVSVKTGSILKNAGEIRPGEAVDVELDRGSLRCEVLEAFGKRRLIP